MKEDRAPHFLALLYNLCTRDIVYDPENAATLVRQAKEVPTQGSLNSRHGGSTREQGGGSKGGKGKGKNRKRGPEDEQGGGKRAKVNEGTTERTEELPGGTDAGQSFTLKQLNKVCLVYALCLQTTYQPLHSRYSSKAI